MNEPDASVTGVVLAGGRSRRFGRDKLAEPYGDGVLLHRPVLAIGEVCDEVVVVIAPDAPEPEMPAGVEVTFARDAEAEMGPLAGLIAGLTAASEGWAVVVGGDMPELQSPVILEMLRAGHETGAVAVALSDGGDARPLPIVLRVGPARVAAERLLATDRRRLRDLLADVHTVVIDEPTWTALDADRRTLLDVDEASDLEQHR
jgi:molybdopterin-guanine dinucleotide biosynthesis protein A